MYLNVLKQSRINKRDFSNSRKSFWDSLNYKIFLFFDVSKYDKKCMFYMCFCQLIKLINPDCIKLILICALNYFVLNIYRGQNKNYLVNK